MATKFYKGRKPLLSQPSIGGGLLGRAYIGGQVAYGTAPISEPTTDGLILYFDAGVTDSYPGSGTVWTDISPQAQTTLAINGAPPYTSGDDGFFSLNGTDEYARDNQNDAYFTQEVAGNDISFEAVFKTDTTSGYRVLASYWDTGADGQTWWWGLSGATAGGIHFALRESSAAGGSSQFYNSSDIVDTDTWIHMVWNLTYETSGNGTLNCWINNTQVITDDTLTLNDMRAGTTGRMNIGRQESDGSYFDGDIAAIRLYDNKNLTTDEIQQNYEYFQSRGYSI